MTCILFAISFAILNRGRGTHFWNSINSTVVSRLLAVLGMTTIASMASGLEEWKQITFFVWTFASLVLWASPGWDKYWCAAIGNPTDITTPSFLPVDWIMAVLPKMPLRLWGIVAMGLRQSLAAPCIIGMAFMTDHPENAYYAVGTLLLGLPYFIAGCISKSIAVPFAEYCVGSILGVLINMTIN